jgi:hypothetical protein
VQRAKGPDITASEHTLPAPVAFGTWEHDNDGNGASWQWCVEPMACRAVAVAAGDAHSLALMADGRCFAWGKNHEGQCGVSLRELGARVGCTDRPELLKFLPYPRPVADLSAYIVRSICAAPGLSCFEAEPSASVNLSPASVAAREEGLCQLFLAGVAATPAGVTASDAYRAHHVPTATLIGGTVRLLPSCFTGESRYDS